MDIQFEPSPVWHDEAVIVTSDPAKVYLRNLLTKSKGQAKEFKAEGDKKRREVDDLKRIRQNVRDGRDKRDEVELARSIFNLQEDLHLTDRQKLTAEVETSTITSVVGDLSFGAQNHNFRSQTFKIPTNCDLCGERIWGLSAKGFDCRDCGYTCHSKCQMKVPAECPGEQSKEDKKRLKVERQESANATPVIENQNTTSNGASQAPSLSRRDTMNSLSSGYAASTNRSVSGFTTPQIPEGEAAEAPAPVPQKSSTLRRNRMAAPPPTQYTSGPAEEKPLPKTNEPRGKMLYPYQANGYDEISVDEGQDITVVEPDGMYFFFFFSWSCLQTANCQSLILIFLCRWLWLDACSRWCTFWVGSSLLRRFRSLAFTCCITGCQRFGSSSLDIFNIKRVFGWQYRRQAKRACCSS